MRRESYLWKPQELEVHAVKNGTDIILRRDITQTTRKEENVEETVWECEERQFRYNGTLTDEKVSKNFNYYWSLAEGRTEEESADESTKKVGEPKMEYSL